MWYQEKRTFQSSSKALRSRTNLRPLSVTIVSQIQETSGSRMTSILDVVADCGRIFGRVEILLPRWAHGPAMITDERGGGGGGGGGLGGSARAAG